MIQAGAALLWIAYGVSKQALPVIVANAVVAGMAVWSMWRSDEEGVAKAKQDALQ
jgi:hypothetical protein